jgi:integrase
MASIVKRPGPKGSTAWQALVRKKGYPNQIKTFDRKIDAVSWARKVEHEMATGMWRDTRDAGSTSLAQAIDRYIEQVSVRKRAKTQISEKLSAKYIKKELGKYTLLQVTPEKVSAYRDMRLNSMSPNSVRIELALLSAVYSIAEKEWSFSGLDNPVKKITKPRIPEGRCPILSEEQIMRLLEECRDRATDLLYPFVLLALHTGCRSMELRGLRWSQVDLKEGFISLVGAETKGHRSRVIPLTREAAKMLQETARPSEGDNVVPMFDRRNALVFPSRNDPNEPRDMHMSFNRAVERAGLDDLPGFGKLRIHDLRHLCGTYLVMNGVDLETVRSVLGHRDLNTTKRYVHVVNEHKKKALEKIGHLGISRKAEK